MSTLVGSKKLQPQPTSNHCCVFKFLHASMLKVLFLIWLLETLNGSFCFDEANNKRVEKWTVGIPQGVEVDRVALESGCKNLGLIPGFDDVYLFEKHPQAHPANRDKRFLGAHPLVSWVEPELFQKRFKRDAFIVAPGDGNLQTREGEQLSFKRLETIQRKPKERGRHHAMLNRGKSSSAPTAKNFQAHFQRPPSLASYLFGGSFSSSSLSSAREPLEAAPSKQPFNDELYSHQWYLQDNADPETRLQNEISLRVEDVWRMGYTGAGVVVTILDDGLEWNHTDIFPNYDARASWDMNNNRSDPFPRYDIQDSNSHGTRCAGEIAMVANNRKCGVGVAPRARIGGIKCLDGEVADHIESMSLLHNIDYIDIYSGSWGPSDNGQVVDGPKRLASQALERGVKFGRRGKGSLYVWANGNGGALGDNCNCDGYVNSIYTISIGGVTQQGQIPFYGERCASTLAVTCSSGAYNDRKIVTTDLHNKCTIDYTGTSAAAPLAAGIYALTLEANQNLTWRDVQHLTALTSNPIPLRDNRGWKRNAAGLIFNSRFGFGLLNAKAMVEAALKWQTAPQKSSCSLAPATDLPVFLQSRQMKHAIFVSNGCRQHNNKQQQQYSLAYLAKNGQKQHLGPITNGPPPVAFLEHVQVIIDLAYTSRGRLEIFLVSPAGTVSTLLSRRPLDMSENGFTKWALMSVHFWGESAVGQWTLIVRDKEGSNDRGQLTNATLVLHGTSSQPASTKALSSNPGARYYENESKISTFLDPVLEFDEDDFYDLSEMSLNRDDSFQPSVIRSFTGPDQLAIAQSF